MLFKPDFALSTKNKDITKALTDRVSSIDVYQYAGMQSDQLILVLDNHPSRPIQLPTMGDTIKVALGYKEGENKKHREHGEYEIAEFSLSGSRDSLTIYANKLGFTGEFKAPKQVSWPSTEEAPLELKKVVEDIAGNHGLEAKINQTLGQIQLPQIDQSESDMQLLTRLAGMYDATVKVVNNLLVFMPRSSGQSLSGQNLPPVALTRAEMIKWDMLKSAQPSYQSCKAYYYDWLGAERKSVSAGSGSPCFTLNHTLADEQTATHAATAKLNDFKRTEHTISVSAIGNQELIAAGMVEITEVRAESNNNNKEAGNTGIYGKWCLTKVHHRIDSHGFTSHFEGEKATE